MREKEIYQKATMVIRKFTVDDTIYTSLIGGNESEDMGELLNVQEKGMLL